MRIEVNERDAWRKPLVGTAEDTYGPDRSNERFQRSIVFYIKGDPEEAKKRFLAGEVCPSCLEVFPVPPCKANLHRFREIYGDKPHPIGTNWFNRVVAGCCPICGNEVSPEMAAAMYREEA